jgi:hypothetical protein
VCVCEKEKKNVKGEKMGSFEKLWGDNPLGPKKKKKISSAPNVRY